jgi:uncharacterized protein (TIGR03437 family)
MSYISKRQPEGVLSCSALFLACAPLYGQVSVLTWHNDNARTGQNLQETILTPANVNASTFGKLFAIQTDGKVDAQPLYVPGITFSANSVHNTLFVVTEHDSAYAFDADTGAELWHVSLLGANETTSDDRGCGQVVPEIGITSTPAIDLQSGQHGTMYVVAMSKDGSGNYHQRLHALDLTTGAEQFGGPVEIRATYPGSGSESTFDPKVHKERPGLLIVNGAVYTSWGSHCDGGSYNGWLIGYSETTLAQVSVLNLVPNGSDGGIWASGAGPAADASGNIFLATGNGSFDTRLNSNGFPALGDYGNAFVKISTANGGSTVMDYFTMSNTTPESNADLDLGSGGLMLLPMLNDAQGNPHALAVGGGKDGNIYIVDQNNLGKFNSNANSIYQQLAAEPIFSSPAWFNGTLYYGPAGSSLMAFAFTNGLFGSAPASQSSIKFAFPGATPSISATGTSNAIVWAAENATAAVLHAYDAQDLSRELYNSNQAGNARDHFGEGNKFIVPTVANGKVYVGTTTGVGVFGLLASATPAPVVTSVTNAASFASGAIAPGEIVTIKGTSLGSVVLFGDLQAPVVYASATQVNAIVPYEIAGQSQAVLQVQNQAGRSTPTNLPVAAAAPGIFTSSFGGSGQAVAMNQDGSLNGPSNPAAKGSYVTLYFTGGGQTNPPGVTGSVTGTVLEYLNQNVSVMVAGVAATVSFAGAAPELISGVGQLNIRLADNAPSGSAEPVIFNVGGIASPSTATLAVQ